MNFDLRLPLGLMFTIFGVMLVGYSFVADPAIYDKSLGINVNRSFGAIDLVFGLWMLILAMRAKRARDPAQA